MRLRSDFALYLMTAFLASCDVAPHTYEIGDELVLEITPPKFSTIVDNTACEQWLTAIERGDLQAFPPKTDTVIVQEGSVEVSVKPCGGSCGRSCCGRHVSALLYHAYEIDISVPYP